MLSLTLLCPASIANGQSSSQPLDLSLPPGLGTGNSRSDQELDIQADPKLLDKRKGWRLEAGQFSDDSPTAQLQPGHGAEFDSYSGIRLRAPLQGVP